MLALGLVLAWATGFTIPLKSFTALAIFSYLAITGMLLRRLGKSRCATGLETMTLVYGQGVVGFFLLVPGVAVGFPFADPLLNQMDKALNFNWVAYAYGIKPFNNVLWPAYASFKAQPALIVILLAALGKHLQCWRLVTAATLTLLLNGLIFPFFPAEGAFTYYQIDPATYPPLDYNSTPFNFVPVLHKIQDGYRVLDASLAAGLVSFPSYHAGSALLFTWAGWSIRPLRWPLAMWNLLLVLGTPVFGSHYLVDVLGGFATAGVGILFAQRFVTQ